MIDQVMAEDAFKEYINRAEQDPRILGALFGGGRSKGVFTENSDYDVILVTTDESIEDVRKDYPKSEYIDSLPHPITDFRARAMTDRRTRYDKYTFTHAKALFDKTGEIQKLIDEKGVLAPEEAQKLAHDSLGGYFNSIHRSFKNGRDTNNLALLLDAQESIGRILDFIFALERRVRPFNKFLKWELENYPLQKLPVSTSDFLKDIEVIAKSGDVTTQRSMMQIIRAMALENGHKDVVDSWEGYWFGE